METGYCLGLSLEAKVQYEKRITGLEKENAELLKEIEELKAGKARAESSCVQMAGTIRHLREQINVPARWISVKEKLPELWHMDDKDRTLINYLVYSPDYGVDVGNYIKPAKRWVCMGLPINVTHWMPMPEPPKEETC